MTHIEQMIKDMCPHGVEFKTLGEVCYTIKDGMHNLPTSTLTETDYPIISAQNIYENKIDYTAKRYVDIETYEQENKRTRVEAGDVLLTIVATIGRSAVVKESRPVLLQRSVCVLKPKDIIIPAFLKYYLDTKPVQAYMVANAHGAAQAGLYINQVEQIEIPLPPLEIQKKIVECLDKFSALAAELQAELQMRRKQYEYYRTQLLTPHSDCNSADNIDDRKLDSQGYTKGIAKVYDWQWKTLGEIGKVCMCKRILKNQTNTEGGIPFYKIGSFGGTADAYIDENTYIEYKKRYSYPKKGDILISAAGTIGKSVIFDGTPSYFQDSNIVWIANDESIVLNKYLYYYYQIVDWKVDDGGVIKRLYNDNLKATPIAFPPLAEQARIVAILDKFEALTTSLSDGIPAEQAAQQKRYEYYRDLLLTFDRKAE